MKIKRELKYLLMTWDEDSGVATVATFDRQTGEETGRIELNTTYMFSVMRFFLSIAQRYINRGIHHARKQNKEVVQPEA